MINDVEFGVALAPEIAVHYRAAKAWSSKVPEAALLRLRAMSEACCSLLEHRHAIAHQHNGKPDLIRRLERLAAHGIITTQLWQLFDRLRIMGNKAAHPNHSRNEDARLPEFAELAMNQALGVMEEMWVLLHPGQPQPAYSVQSVDDNEVARTCERAVIDGDPESQFTLGKLLMRKSGDLYRASKVIAVQNEGGMLSSPESLKAWEQAVFWYRQSADGGYLPALTEYGIALIGNRLNPEDMRRGRELVRRACEQGEISAHAFTGYSLLYGSDGYELNPALARSHLERAAEADHPVAIAELGRMCWLGIDGYKDPERGAALTLRAAELGNAEAQFNAHILLTNGVWLEIDRDGARQWLEKAVQQDHDHAAIALSRMLREEPEAPAHFAEVERLLKTAMVNLTLAHYELATLYLEAGNSVIHTVNAAHLIAYCYRTALKEGDAEMEAACFDAGPIVLKKLKQALPHTPLPLLRAAMQVQAEYHASGRPCRYEHDMSARHEEVMRTYDGMMSLQKLMGT